jgi:hypothetical protein
MASRTSISIRINAAIEEIETAVRALYGEEFKLPTQGKDIELVRATQLEAIASKLKSAVAHQPTGLEAFPVLEPVVVTVATPNGVEPHVAPTPVKQGRGKGKRA